MSGPDQRDMEQPWPPPGPWSFPRTGGEAEEESDVDVSPSSSHFPPVPGGGAQVRAACVRGGRGGGRTRRNVRGHRGGGGARPLTRPPTHPQRWQPLPPRAHPPASTSPRPRSPSPVSAGIRGPPRLHNVDPLSSGTRFHPSLLLQAPATLCTVAGNSERLYLS